MKNVNPRMVAVHGAHAASEALRQAALDIATHAKDHEHGTECAVWAAELSEEVSRRTKQFIQSWDEDSPEPGRQRVGFDREAAQKRDWGQGVDLHFLVALIVLFIAFSASLVVFRWFM